MQIELLALRGSPNCIADGRHHGIPAHIPDLVYNKMMKEPLQKRSKKNTIWYSERLLDEVREWPAEVREEMGGQLNKVEYGGEPDDFKPMQTIGTGVNEIRVSEKGDHYRLIYVAKFEEAVYVLHVISKKKTQKTTKSDIDLASKRYSELIERRKKKK